MLLLKNYLVISPIFLSLIFTIIGGCSSKVGTSEAKEISVGLCVVGSLTDNPYTANAYEGLKKAKEKLGVKIKGVETTNLVEIEELLRGLAKEGNDLVIGVGSSVSVAIEKLSKEFPETKFALIDGILMTTSPNVVSIGFKEHEGSFLAGALAGLMTKTNKVGFIGAQDIPIIRRFSSGYEQGVKYVNPKAKVFLGYALSFTDPDKGKEIALAQFTQGVDIIFHAAGKTGEGVIDAIKETKKYGIGVDYDQDHMALGLILTSMLKRMDMATYDVIKRAVKGKFESGVLILGLQGNYVGLTNFRYTKRIVPKKYRKKLDEIKEMIINKEIMVKDAL